MYEPDSPRSIPTIDREKEIPKIASVDADSPSNCQTASAENPLEARLRNRTGAHLAALLGALLNAVDPDIDGDERRKIGKAIHHATEGGDDGLELIDWWSKKGKKYKGRQALELWWHAQEPDRQHPVTIAALQRILDSSGIDWRAICSKVELQFEPGAVEANSAEMKSTAESRSPINPLDLYSLRDREHEVAALSVIAVAILGQLALLGQFTIFFAAANTGKTLLVLFFLIESIRQGVLEPSKVYYLDFDDNVSGLLEKLRIAKEYGFHILAEGHLELSVPQFIRVIMEMTENNQAHGVVIVLDTLKKFVNVMDKNQAREFNRVIRRFIMKGGTVIALAHTNKNSGPHGKPVYGGTSDMLDDADCVYTLRAIRSLDDSDERVVEFENIKRRGDVATTVSFKYSVKQGISYAELLSSVQRVGETELVPSRQAAALQADAPVISAIEACIRSQINTRMKLRDAVAERMGIALRAAIQVIDRYTGDDPAAHRWNFAVHERGAKVYRLHDSVPPLPNPARPQR